MRIALLTLDFYKNELIGMRAREIIIPNEKLKEILEKLKKLKEAENGKVE